MVNKPEVLAIIPARGGSKGIPHKNIKLFAGHPLIAYSIMAARQAETVTRVIVSTDDPEIADVARKYGAEVPFMRPDELAQDATLDLPVFQHALAWLVARMVFGASHPAVSFLLLLAVADDAIGLAIIAIFYPDPTVPTAPAWLFLTVLGMAASYLLRTMSVKSYWPYIIIGGGLSWTGLFLAHLHPALALVFIVPFLPHARREFLHLFEDDPRDRSTLATFEHEWKIFVDFGLFMFGLANAGVVFSGIGVATWLVLVSLIVGKTLGISAMGFLAKALGFPLPERVGAKELVMIGDRRIGGGGPLFWRGGLTHRNPGAANWCLLSGG